MEDLRNDSFVSITFETVKGHSKVNGKVYSNLPVSVGIYKSVNGIGIYESRFYINPEVKERGWKSKRRGLEERIFLDALTWPKVWKILEQILMGTDRVVLVAHDHTVNKKVLQAMQEIYGTPVEQLNIHWVDTLDLAKLLRLKKTSFEAVCEKYHCSLDSQTELDVVKCYALIYFCLMGDVENFEDVHPALISQKISGGDKLNCNLGLGYDKLPLDLDNFFQGKKVFVDGYGSNVIGDKKFIMNFSIIDHGGIPVDCVVDDLDIMVCEDLNASYKMVMVAKSRGAIIINDYQFYLIQDRLDCE